MDSELLLDEMRSEFRALGVRFERLEGVVAALAEGLVTTREELKRDNRELEERLSWKLRHLEEAVRQNSADIQKNSADIQKSAADIRALQVEVANLKERFDRRDEREDVRELERRVTVLEDRAGITRT